MKRTLPTLMILIVLHLPSLSSAVVYFSDNFDDQDDWGPTQNDCDNENPERLPPPPWDYVSCNNGVNTFIDSSAAHGENGKGYGINWTQSMSGRGLSAPVSVLQGKTEIWVGFWWKHNSGWDWGTDVTHKWFRFAGSPTDTINLNYDQNHRVIVAEGDTMFKSDIPFDTADGSWHKFIIYLKHNDHGQSNGEIRLWRDGVEAVWTKVWGNQSSNQQINFGEGDTFPPFNLAWGYQSRPNWGPGNKSFFDSIIVASSREDVETFLGGDDPPKVVAEPKNLQIGSTMN